MLFLAVGSYLHYISIYLQLLQDYIAMKKVLLLAFAAAFIACNPTINPGPDPSREPGNDPSANPSDPSGNPSDPSGNPTDEPSGDTFEPEDWYETNFWERSDAQKLGLRGPVKKLKNPKIYYTYEFDRDGRLIYEWYGETDEKPAYRLTKFYYDDKGRLIKTEEGTPAGSDSHDFLEEEVFWKYNPETGTNDKCVKMTVTEFEYGSGSQLVFAGDALGLNIAVGGYRMLWNMVLRGLVASHQYEQGEPYGEEDIREFIDRTYSFDGSGKLVMTRDWYHRTPVFEYEDLGGGAKRPIGWHYGEIMETQEQRLGTWDFTYEGDYPVAGGFASGSRITWAANGMPATIEYENDGVWTFAQGKRYVNPVGWKTNRETPILGVETLYEYNDNEDIIREDDNLGSWVRPIVYHDYVYDSHGNWTSVKYDMQTVFDGPESPAGTWTDTRVIEYY